MAQCCWQAGWDKCFCLDGGTLIVQFASSVCLCGVQDVQGLRGLKVSQSGSQVQGMLQDLARRALRVRCETRQVDTQSLLPRLVSRFCAMAQPSHSHTPPPTGHQPPQTHGPTGSGLATMGQLGISRLAVLSLPRHASIPWRLLGTVHLHWSRPKRRQRRSLLGQLLRQHPRDPPPRLFQPDPSGGTPQPQVPPRCHVFPLPELLLLQVPKPPGQRKFPQWRHLQDPVPAHPKAVPGLPLCIPGPAPDVHLLGIEMAGEGETWGHIGPHRCPIGGVSSADLPPCLHHAPL